MIRGYAKQLCGDYWNCEKFGIIGVTGEYGEHYGL